MKRKHFLFTLSFIFVAKLFAFTPVSTEQLLISYLENDLELQKATLAAEKANLTYESSKIDNGITVNLSSGSVSLKTSKEGLSVKASPSVKVVVPGFQNLTVSARTSLQNTSNPLMKPVSDTTVGVDIDIISNASKQNDINKETADRNKTVALRNLNLKALEKEKAFYNEMKALLSSFNSIVQEQQKLYNDLKDFESVKAKGYAPSSSKYRTSELNVLSDKNSIQSSIKSFINDFVLFYKKCGVDLEVSAKNFMDLIPSDILDVTLLNVEDFDKEDFIELENAKWTYEINNKKREINNSLSLSANAGYTFNNTLTNSDTVNFGLNSTIGGVSLSAGMNMPTTSDPYPTFTFSAGVNPFTFKKDSIKKEQDKITQEQELLDIKTAEMNYENFVISAKQDYEDLIWKSKTTKTNYEMYADLEKDMKQWYESGVVSESDYLSAITNASLYRVKMIINQIDLIIYNNDITRRFIQH